MKWAKMSRIDVHRLATKLIFSLTVISCFHLNNVNANKPPKFIVKGDGEIVLRLREGTETPVGAVIYRLRAEDADGDPILFGLQGPIAKELLRIEQIGPTEATVSLKRLLDRETEDEYSVVFTLTDGKLGDGNFITQSMHILVEDVNDNEPVFRTYNSTIFLRENSPPGVIATLEATDRDEGLFGQVFYFLQETDGRSNKFEVKTVNSKAVLSLVGKLDYEEKYLYQVQILAVDGGTSGKRNTGIATLLIKVLDMEDQPPEFVRVPSVTRIPENLPRGSLVLQVRAVDGDRGVNNEILYKIKEGGDDLFSIKPATGHVYVQHNLDREDTQGSGAYILTIEAIEINSAVRPAPSSTAEVTVILVDINDEAPTFKSKNYTGEIVENAQVNVPISLFPSCIPEVFDRDQGNNGTFRLHLENDNGTFEVTPSEGINEVSFLIRVRNPIRLDYEKITGMRFKLVATEIVSANPKSTSADVVVYIRDANDNIPEFSQSEYLGTVAENARMGTTVAWIQARDADSGNFGTKGIRFTELRGQLADKLYLDPITGYVTIKNTNHSLDREQASIHYLTVEARDNLGTGNRNTVQLRLEVSDVNDETPRFIQSRYEARLIEGEDDFLDPLVVQAFDRDLNGTNNSQVRYYIKHGDYENNFTINKITGRLSLLQPVDFERMSGHSDVRTFNLSIEAVDLGVPPRSSYVPVTIYVQDANDYAPAFHEDAYSATIREDMASGTAVVQVQATDNDGSSINRRIVYRIQSGALDKFVIDAESGVISVAQGANLDPDLTDPKTTVYLLEVIALDGGIGTEQKSDAVMVNISITDVNNKPPEVEDPYTIIVKEDINPGTPITKLLAYDPDERPELRFLIDVKRSEARNEEGTLISLKDFNYTSLFMISPMDGTLTVVGPLDREKIETVKLAIRVEDIAAVHGVQTTSTTLTISIEDVNDNNPIFRKAAYLRNVTENAKEGTTIATITADDADKNRTIKYTLLGTEELLDLLYLDPETGELIVAGKIDREQHEWLNLTVRATDNGEPPRSSHVSLGVFVVDENDNNPVFEDAGANAFNFTIFENAERGTEVGRIHATDADSGEYGRITYKINRRSSQGKFDIDPDSGIIYVTDMVDREIQDTFNILVEAWDNYDEGFLSGESRNAFKQIAVKIMDVNDKVPQLAKQTADTCAVITEFHKLDDVILMIKAYDADEVGTKNSKVDFSIIDGNQNHLFKVVPGEQENVAKVISVKSLRRQIGNYSLKIQGVDNGVPPLASALNYRICVLDYNDNAPQFLSPPLNYTIRVLEDSPIGYKVVEVVATDDDQGLNGAVRYRLLDDLYGHFRMFTINETTGELKLRQRLDREKQKVFEIRVQAFDLGLPTPLASDIDLKIYVKNVIDVDPVFNIANYEVHFTENTRPGEERQQLLEPLDREEYDDDLDKATVCLFIVGGNEGGVFKLDPVSHQLTTAVQLDREARDEYILMVKATKSCLEAPTAASIEKNSKQEIDDNTVVEVIVVIDDVNDNPPRFNKKVFTGGLSTDANFGDVVFKLQSSDPDYGPNSIPTYSIASRVHMTLAEGLNMVKRTPFLVNTTSGDVILNFDPQKDMKGYFYFNVAVWDVEGLNDTAAVYIYLLREDQRVKFIVRMTPEELRHRIDEFTGVLSNVTGTIVTVDAYKYHSDEFGQVDKTRSDVFAHFVHRHDNSVMDVESVLKLLDEFIEVLNGMFRDFNVIETRPAVVQEYKADTERLILVWLIGVCGFLSAMLVLAISLCVSQRSKFQRKLKAATANSFGSTDPGLNPTDVPNTNQHSVEGSNPIWMHSYENEWYKEEDALSRQSDGRNSLDENTVAHNNRNGGVPKQKQNGHLHTHNHHSNNINFSLHHHCPSNATTASFDAGAPNGNLPKQDTKKSTLGSSKDVSNGIYMVHPNNIEVSANGGGSSNYRSHVREQNNLNADLSAQKDNAIYARVDKSSKATTNAIVAPNVETTEL